MHKLSPWVKVFSGLALSALSAALLLLAMPPYGLWPLTLIGFGPMLIAQYRLLPRRLANVAPAIGIGGYLGLVLYRIFPTELADRAPWLPYFPLVVVAIVYLAEAGSVKFHTATRYRWFVLNGALVWVGIELIRELIVGTGGFIAYAFYQAPLLLQPMSVFGIFGLSLMATLIGYTLGLAAIAVLDRLSPPDGSLSVPWSLARRWLIVTAVLAALWIGLGLIQFQPATTPTVRVAAVQPGVPNLPNLMRGTREAAQHGARVIVWPEGALGFDPQVTRSAELKALAAETGAYLVIGYGFNTPQGLRNEAISLSPDGVFESPYGKDHPVAWLGETSLTRGAYPVVDAPFGALGTIICYDLAFTDSARNMARQGARLIAAPSNDWQALHDTQYLMPVFRAIENRVALIKADTQYDSVIVDAYGRTLALSSQRVGGSDLLVADVPIGLADAPQIFLGDWIGWISLAGLIFFMLGSQWLEKRG